ncbi:hypothetical protein [Actinoallomurus acanthiterrae]
MACDQITALRRRFPGLTFWFGSRTRTWWALVLLPGGWRLVEAADPEELTRAIIQAMSWPWPSPRQGARWTVGANGPTVGTVA